MLTDSSPHSCIAGISNNRIWVICQFHFPNVQESTEQRLSCRSALRRFGKNSTPVLLWTSLSDTWNSWREYLFSIGLFGTMKHPMAEGLPLDSTRMTLYKWVGTETWFFPITYKTNSHKKLGKLFDLFLPLK